MAARMQSERASGYRMKTVEERESGIDSIRVECSKPIWRIRARDDFDNDEAAEA
jgi:hypothetical protein